MATRDTAADRRGANRRRKIGVGCLCAALMLAPATLSAEELDDETVAKAVEQHNSTAADPDKVICKRVRQTGTHFRKRVCQTRRQMDEARAQAQADADQLTRGTASNTGN